MGRYGIKNDGQRYARSAYFVHVVVGSLIDGLLYELNSITELSDRQLYNSRRLKLPQSTSLAYGEVNSSVRRRTYDACEDMVDLSTLR